MDKAKLIKKLYSYRQDPDLYRAPSNEELADLVILVLNAVKTIEEAVETKRFDIETKYDGEAKKVLQKATDDSQRLLREVKAEVNRLIAEGENTLTQTSTELERRVQQALQNIRDGQDGIVTEAEIERAANIAVSLIELPDFEGMMTEAIQGNGALIRDALESLPEGEEQLTQDAIQGLVPRLKELQERIERVTAGSGNGIGKNQVYNFIAQAVADGTIPAGGGGSSLPDQTGNAGKFLTTDGSDASWGTPAGSGDVVGPASAVDSNLAAFDTTTGKLIKDGGATIAAVRNRSTHTGTQTAATISDFDTEVANNSAVAANTAKVTNATHTGDVTGATALTIANNAVTNDKAADMAVNTIKGRITAGTGDPEDLTATQVRAITETETTTQLNTRDTNNRARANHTGTQTASTISDFDTEVSNNTDVAANTAARHAAVTVTDSAEIDFTLTGQDITASLVAGSIDESKLDTSVNASLDLADSAVQPASPTLTGTTTVDRLDYDQAVGTVVAGGALGATETIDWAAGTHFSGTLDSNITFTYSNAVSGQSITLYLTFDTAQRTITWPTTTWLDNDSGAAPTAPAASGNVLVVTLQDLGGTIYGSATGNYAVYA